jgi:hypothetical protein
MEHHRSVGEEDDSSVSSSDIWFEGGCLAQEEMGMHLAYRDGPSILETEDDEGLSIGPSGRSSHRSALWEPSTANSSSSARTAEPEDTVIRMQAQQDSHEEAFDEDLQGLLDCIPLGEDAGNSMILQRGSQAHLQPISPEWHFSGNARALACPLPQQPSSQDELERSKALVRAKDRLLSERQDTMDAMTQEIRFLTNQRDSLQTECASWQESHRDMQHDNSRLQENLSQAETTIQALREQAAQLQAHVTNANTSIDELHERLRHLESGESIMTASKYEAHLRQFAEHSRSEILSVCEQKDALQKLVSNLQDQLAGISGSKAIKSTPGSLKETSSQTEHDGFTAENVIFNRQGVWMGEDVMQAMQAKVLALECQIKSQDIGKRATSALKSDALNIDENSGNSKTLSSVRETSLVLQVQKEFTNIQQLNEELMRSNDALIAANQKLQALVDESVPKVHAESRPERQKTSNSNSHSEDVKTLLAKWDDAKQSEIRKITGLLEKEKNEAIKAAVEEQQKLAEAREKQLQSNKEAETKRLRSAWQNNMQRTITAVEQRCARELKEALALQRKQTQEENGEIQYKKAYINASAQAFVDHADACVCAFVETADSETQTGSMQGASAGKHDEIILPQDQDAYENCRSRSIPVQVSASDLLAVPYNHEAIVNQRSHTCPHCEGSLRHVRIISDVSQARDCITSCNIGVQTDTSATADEGSTPRVASCSVQTDPETQVVKDHMLKPSLEAEKRRLDQDAEEQIHRIRKLHLLEKHDAIARLEAELKSKTDEELAIVREHCEKEMQQQIAKVHSEYQDKLEQFRGHLPEDRSTANMSFANGSGASGSEAKEKIDQDLPDHEKEESISPPRKRSHSRALDDGETEEMSEDELGNNLGDAMLPVGAFKTMQTGAQGTQTRPDESQCTSTESLEFQENIGFKLNQELAAVREVHENELKKSIHLAESELQQRLAELVTAIEEQYESSKTQYQDMARRELKKHEAAIMQRNNDALRDLRRRLAEDRKDASLRAIDNAIQTAVSVREQTQKILQEELAKEMDVARAAHARRCEDARRAIKGEMVAEEENVKAEMQRKHRENMQKLKHQLEQEHHADMMVLRKEFSETMERAFAEMRAKADMQLAEEYESNETSLKKRRQEAEQRLSELQEQTDAECAVKELMLRERLSTSLRECISRAESQLSEMLSSARIELLKLASSKCQPVYDEFHDTLSQCLSAYQQDRDVEFGAEMDAIERDFERRKADALQELEQQARTEITRMLRDLLGRAAQERDQKVAETAAHLEAARERKIREVESMHEEAMEKCLRDAADKFSEERQAELKRVRNEENEKLREAVVNARRSAEREEEEYLRALASDLEKELLEIEEKEGDAQGRRLEKDVEALKKRLLEERESELARIHEEFKESTQRQEEILRRQAGQEKDRAVHIARKSRDSERVQRMLSLESKAQEELNVIIMQCKNQHAAKKDAELQALSDSLEKEKEDAVAQIKEDSDRHIANALQEAKERLDAEKSQRIKALREKMHAEKEEALHTLKETMEANISDDVARLRSERRDALRRELEVVAVQYEGQLNEEERALRERSNAASSRALSALEKELSVSNRVHLKCTIFLFACFGMDLILANYCF